MCLSVFSSNALINSIIFRSWDKKPDSRDFESVPQTNQILAFISAAGDLMTDRHYSVYQIPQDTEIEHYISMKVQISPE